MKKFMFFAATIAALTLSSCGGDSKGSADSTAQEAEEKVEAQTLEIPFLAAQPITGEHADYFAVVGEGITINGTPKENGNGGTIRATVNLDVKKAFDKLHGFAVFPPMTVNFLDADKNRVEYYRLEMSKADQDIILAELKKANPGTVEISYVGDFYPSGYNKIFSNTKYVQIDNADLSDGTKKSSTSDVEPSVAGSEDDDSSSEAASVSSSTSSSNDYDDFLDQYEKYVDSYIATYKKAQNGDPTAYMEYASMLQEAQSMASQLENAKGEMTSAQLARFNKIMNKMANAAF